MGKGYHILVWDGWGFGLNMINPRLHTEGVGFDNNPINWFPVDKELAEDEIVVKHKLNSLYNHFKIIY